MRLTAATLFLLLLWSCSTQISNAPDRHSTEKLPLGHAEKLVLNLKLGAGDLQLDGGARDLVDADFTYNIASWKPRLTTTTSGAESRVTIEQPSGLSETASHYGWDVRINDNVPTRLGVDFGAGSGELKLGSLSLQNLDVHMGVGELSIEMSGRLKQDCVVNLVGGVGKLNVRLPDSARIEATLVKGMGTITVSGMEPRENQYFREGPGKTIQLHVTSGLGSIEVRVE